MNETTNEAIQNRTDPVAAGEQDDEISLLDLAIVLAKHKTLLIGLPAIVAVLSIIASLLMTQQFTATAKMLPPEKSQGAAAAMAAQLGGLAGLAGGVVKSPNDLYIAMMKSRTLQESMIKRFDLMKLWEAEFISDACKHLEGITTITSGKDSIIAIEVTDADPKRAAEYANAYVEELSKLTGSMATTEAGRRRLFFEGQFLKAKENLAKAEMVAKQGLEKGGLIKVDDQGKTMVESMARLRGQITVKEVQIGAMRSFAAEGNPELKMAQQELSVLKGELAKAEGALTAKVGPGGTALHTQGFENLNLLRDLKYFETIYEMLARQYELAKIDEAKEAAIIQVLDAAVAPDRKSKPKRAQIVLLATLAAGFVAVLLAFVIEAMGKASRNPEQRERLAVFRAYLKAPLRRAGQLKT